MANTIKDTDPASKPAEGTIEARYQRAQTLLQGMLSKDFVLNSTLYPTWIDDSDCCWYERRYRQEGKELSARNKEHKLDPYSMNIQGCFVPSGKEYRLVNPGAASNVLAFDHHALANALAEAVEQDVDASDLPISKVNMSLNNADLAVKTVRFTAFDKRWIFDVESSVCKSTDNLFQDNAEPVEELTSPDGRYTAFARDYNLWIRDLKNGNERALTRDGEADYGYAIAGSAWGFLMEADLQVRWSPDSKQLLTVQKDKRQVLTLPVVHHVPQEGGVRPVLESRKIAFPGDDHVETVRLLAIDVATGHPQPANYPHIPVTRNGFGFFSANLAWWASDSRRAYFVDMARDYKTVRVVEFDTVSGSTKILFEETSDTQINLMLNADEYPSYLPLPKSGELLWFSERSGWAHLYLYDLETGELKNTVTQGDWLVRYVVSFDPKRREVFVQTAGRGALNGSEATVDRDPYYRDLARVQIDSGEIMTIAASDHEIVAIAPTDLNRKMAKTRGYHETACGVSPSGNFAVITRSRADGVPVSLLIDRDGNDILELETADISALLTATDNHWQWPEPVKLRAADDSADTYGLVFRPSNFSPDRSYPVLSHVFNSPELPWVSKGSFSNGMFFGVPYLEAAAFAELGFIVVQVDGRGTPYRHKAFHDECYGWAESASNLDDHVAGIKQLAQRYAYMDLDRVGISSIGGGPGGLQGLLQHPEFYKVGVTGAAHDSRLGPASMWGEKFEGLSGPADGHQYPEQQAEKLKGKLLLTHGMLDRSAPITFRWVEALQKANKDFELLLLPNLGHSYSSYQIRRTWDYLLRHLQEVEPPKEFLLKTPFG